MEELNNFQIFAQRILFFVGWIIARLRSIFIGDPDATLGFDSPLLWLTFGLFFAFAALHIFKRILRKD